MTAARRLGFAGAVAAVMLLSACAGNNSGGAVDPDSPNSSVTSTQLPTSPTGSLPPDPAATQTPDAQFLASLNGLTLAEATTKAEKAGYSIRVASVDGKPRALTMDYRFNRINVELVNDHVVAATVG